MTAEQQTLVTDYLRQWRPLAVVKRLHAGVYWQAIRAGVTDADIEAELLDGVVRAAQGFDADKGSSFATYAAMWMRSRLGSLANRPKWHRGVTMLSVDAEYTAAGPMTGSLPDADADAVTDVTRGDDLEDVRVELADLTGGLPERLRTILSLRYGLGGGEPLSYREIGERMGVCYKAVRQWEEEAMALVREQNRIAVTE